MRHSGFDATPRPPCPTCAGAGLVNENSEDRPAPAQRPLDEVIFEAPPWVRADDWARENRVGRRVLTLPMGAWEGGVCEVIAMYGDSGDDPNIVMEVRRLSDEDEIGVFAAEWVLPLPTPREGPVSARRPGQTCAACPRAAGADPEAAPDTLYHCPDCAGIAPVGDAAHDTAEGMSNATP